MNIKVIELDVPTIGHHWFCPTRNVLQGAKTQVPCYSKINRDLLLGLSFKPCFGGIIISPVDAVINACADEDLAAIGSSSGECAWVVRVLVLVFKALVIF